jgi:hypothetical protein
MRRNVKREPDKSYIAGLLSGAAPDMPVRLQVVHLRALVAFLLYELDLVNAYIPEGEAVEKALREAQRQHGIDPGGN